MAQKSYPIINNFSKGELSPRLSGRTDIEAYYQGCKTMLNCIMVSQGGAEKRPGTIYLGEAYINLDTGDSTPVKLIPFEVSDTEIFILEVGHHATRIWDVIAKKLVGAPLILNTPWSWEDIPSLQYVTTEGKIFFAHQKYRVSGIEYKDGTFKFLKYSTIVDPWISGKSYKVGDYVKSGGSYYKCILANSSTSTPAVGVWGDGYPLGTNTPTADIVKYLGGTFNAGDIYTYHGALYEARRTYTGTTACNPGEEIYEYVWSDWSEVKAIWVNAGDRKCTKKWLGICIHVETYGDYAKRTLESPDRQIKITFVWNLLIGAWVRYKERIRHYISTVDSDNPYWKQIATLPGGEDTETIYKYDSTASYDIGDVVYDTNYEMYLAQKASTGVNPGDPNYWEDVGNNPFFSQEGDYPSAIAFKDQRLILGGSTSKPQTFHASKVARYFDFNTGTDDDDAYSFTISTSRSSRIKWILGRDHILIGTSSSEWLATGGQAPITPTNINIFKSSNYGSAYNQAIEVADIVLFFQKGGRILREYVYSNDNKAYLANDLTLFADHITGSGIEESSYQQNPDSILWSIKKDGGLIGLTYDRINRIIGWHRHNTLGEFESVTAISSNGEEDELWFVVRRKVNGVYKRFIEYMAPRINNSDSVFSDSSTIFYAGGSYFITSITNNSTYIEVELPDTTGITDGDTIKLSNTGSSTYDAQIFTASDITATTLRLKRNGVYFTTDDTATYISGSLDVVKDIITGLDHLLGQTVAILGDDAVFPEQEVVAGIDGAGGVGIKLSTPCNKVICGLPYEMQLQPQAIELPGTSTPGSQRRISKVTLKLYNTIGGLVGSDMEHLEVIKYRESVIPFGSPPAKFTGTVEVPIDSSSEKESSIIIVHNQPLPISVSAIITDISYSRV